MADIKRLWHDDALKTVLNYTTSTYCLFADIMILLRKHYTDVNDKRQRSLFGFYEKHIYKRQPTLNNNNCWWHLRRRVFIKINLKFS